MEYVSSLDVVKNQTIKVDKEGMINSKSQSKIIRISLLTPKLGGLVENIPRSIPKHLAAEIFYSKWKLPEFFQWLQTSGNLSDTDMQTIFNCGIGLTIVIAPNEINNLQKVMENRDIKAHVIGKIINQKDNQNIFFT